jgi:hypothetical protein
MLARTDVIAIARLGKVFDEQSSALEAIKPHGK